MTSTLIRRTRPFALYLPIVGWFVAACVLFSKFLAHPTQRLPGGADGILYCWHFEAIQQALWHFENPLHSVAMNAPTGLNVMWNTAILLPAVLLSPLTASIGPIATVGILMWLAPILAATSAYLVLRRFTGRTAVAIISATFYGFGPFFIGHAGHLNLAFAAPALPLLFLIGYDIFVAQAGAARRRGIQLATVVVLTMLIGEEIVAIGAVMAVFAVLFAVLINRHEVSRRRRYAMEATGWAAALSAAALAFPLGYQFFGPDVLTKRIASDQSMDLVGLVRPSVLMRFATNSDVVTNRRFPANDVENTGYLGVALLAVLLGVGGILLIRRRNFGIWWLLMLPTSIALSLGARVFIAGSATAVHGPWALLGRVPVLGSLVPVRFSLATACLASIGIAAGVALVRSRRNYVAACVAVVLCLLTLTPAQRVDEMLNLQSSSFFSTSAARAIPDGANTLVLPMQGDPNSVAQVMYWQLQNKIRFNIYSGYSVFSEHGELRYIPELPLFARVLNASSDSGAEPDASTYTSAKASAEAKHARVVVLMPTLPNRDVVARVAGRIMGCAARSIADVVYCERPR